MTLKCIQCQQAFNLMIRFQCDHLLCLHCFQSLPSPTLPVKCVKCYKATHHFRYKLQTVLQCDHCNNTKAVDEFWWCNNCHQSVCSLCGMQFHKPCPTSRWDDMHIWKFFVDASQQRLNLVKDGYKRDINAYLELVKLKLHREIDDYMEKECAKLIHEDKLVSETMNIEVEHQNTPIQNDEHMEKQRLAAKTHLTKVFEGFRFDGRKVNFNMKAIKFISAGDRDWKFQEVPIDE